MSERVLIADDPYAASDEDRSWNKRGAWPCKWVACADAGELPFVTAYRRAFTVDREVAVRAHVSADERYELFLDGRRVGRGSERGDADNWYFETYDLALAPGEHTLVARVWSQGAEKAPYAQISVYPGFIFSPQDDEFIALLGTGVAPWEAKILGGYEFTHPQAAWGTGWNIVIHGSRFDWNFEHGEGQGWQPVAVRDEGANALSHNDSPVLHRMRPALLPPMLEERRSVGTARLVAAIASTETHGVPIRAADDLGEERGAWNRLLRGEGTVTVPPRTRRRVLIDLENYYCAYPEVIVSGGANALVRVHWQEALFNEPNTKTKGNRDEIEGKYFVTIWHVKDGVGDTFYPDGGERRLFETLWWQCGRYVEVVVETGDDPLTLESVALRETRYPLEMEGAFDTADERLTEIVPIAVRALQMCAHETYMDCPWYEQLMYVGDTRLDVLTTYVLTPDDRLPRKSLRLFDASRQNSGLTQSRYPTRVFQSIPPFSLWWVAMVHDYAWWRDDLSFVRRMMPGVRAVIDFFLSCRRETGLVSAPEGWNFIDWVPTWSSGMPPTGGDRGISGPLNWQFILVLTLAAQLEDLVGEPELAIRARRIAGEMAARARDAFWDDVRGLLADDLEKQNFSEHSQCLAILSGQLDMGRRARIAENLLRDPDLARTTIYFTHYLFETFRTLNLPDALRERLSLWFELRRLGLKTTVEMPEPTRSDCHAWGAHPLFHYYATILGIRPAAPGFTEVEITPQLGALPWAKGTMPHPRGAIGVDIHQESSGALHAEITLPDGVTGVFRYGGKSLPLSPGRQEITPQALEQAPAAPPKPQLQMVLSERVLASSPEPRVPDGYRLRLYTDADQHDYIALMERAGFGRWEPERLARSRRAILPDGFFVIEHIASGKVVATAMATHGPAELHPEGGELSWVAADPDHSGNGLGMAVCAAATARMIAAGYRRIYLMTDDFRLPAVKIYLALGYEPLFHTENMTARWEAIHQALG